MIYLAAAGDIITNVYHSQGKCQKHSAGTSDTILMFLDVGTIDRESPYF